MSYYIKSPDMGLFVGEFLGLGFFESHIASGDCSPKEEAIVFDSKQEAETYLDGWIGGRDNCQVIFD